jgi:hypothetical protein
MKSVQALLVLEAALALYNVLNKFKLNNVVNFDYEIIVPTLERHFKYCGREFIRAHTIYNHNNFSA